ncbi:MAG: M55 family metallopeptidase [Lachnospiraceae bacterium]|jgi:D-amino peptidase|nr:M55 family metallopeptidase [Lachnospiraceae bacterium]
MKLFVSADIEGTCGICSWDETEIGKPGYDRFSAQMSREVAAVCETAFGNANVEGVLVKDAHDYARNIDAAMLPANTRIMRGWADVLGNMMAGVQECDAAVMTGYHSAAYSDGNPLSHTMNTGNMYVKINGAYASEFMLNTWFAAYYGIPVLLLTGDAALCRTAREFAPWIVTVPVNEGRGEAAISVTPQKAVEMIREGTRKALEGMPSSGTEQKEWLRSRVAALPPHFHAEVCFKEIAKAAHGANYKDAVRDDPRSISYSTDDFLEVERFLYFVL